MLGERDCVPVYVTCEKIDKSDSWLSDCSASLHMIPTEPNLDHLPHNVCLKFLFNISKTLVQQDVSSGVLRVTQSATVEAHSIQQEMFS